MNTYNLLENIIFNETQPHAEPLQVEKHGRVLRFALEPQQEVKRHNAPHSPVNIVVLKGQGMFAGGDGVEHLLGPNQLLVIAPGEMHHIRSLDEDLVFLVILHGVLPH